MPRLVEACDGRSIDRTDQCHLVGNELLCPFTPSTFRHRRDALMCRLQVPADLSLSPASLRAGGTLFVYNHGTSVQDLLWRLRLQHLKTLSHYPQEVAPATSLRTMPAAARTFISEVARMCDPLLLASQRIVADSASLGSTDQMVLSAIR